MTDETQTSLLYEVDATGGVLPGVEFQDKTDYQGVKHRVIRVPVVDIPIPDLLVIRDNLHDFIHKYKKVKKRDIGLDCLSDCFTILGQRPDFKFVTLRRADDT